MPLPPHLFKPFDATELHLGKAENLPTGTTANWFSYSPPQGSVAVIKEINNIDTVSGVGLYYYKNGVVIFLHGQTATYPAQSKRPDHYFEFLRDNPIILTDTDTLKIDVGNSSGVPQDVSFDAFGYIYPVNRQRDYEDISKKAKSVI